MARQQQSSAAMAAARRKLLPAWLWPDSGAISPIPALDGLRAVAVLLVMAFHAWYNAPAMDPGLESIARQQPIWYGQTGVQLFFVLSGFLLFLPYSSWILNGGRRPSALKFYRRRALRVGPAFWAAVLILAAAAPWTLATVGYAVLHLFFIFNFVPHVSGQFDSVFWTMAIEVQFYALMPLLAAVLNKGSRTLGPFPALALFVGACAVISVLSHTVEHRYQLGVITWGLFGRYSLSESLGVFGFGIAASMAYTYLVPRASMRFGAFSLRAIAAAAFAGGALAALVLAMGLGNARLISGQVGLAFGVVYATLLLGLLLGPAVLRAPFEARAVRFIGLISYSLYIWHTVDFRPVSSWLAGQQPGAGRIMVAMALMLIVSVPVAYVSYQLFERPFTSIRRRSHDTQAAQVESETTSPVSTGELVLVPSIAGSAGAGE